MSSLNISDIRHRIEDVPKEVVRNVLKTQFLLGARVAEVCFQYYSSPIETVDVGIMLGWANPGLPNMARRYVVMEWRRYLPKLLKPYKQIMKGSK